MGVSGFKNAYEQRFEKGVGGVMKLGVRGVFVEARYGVANGTIYFVVARCFMLGRVDKEGGALQRESIVYFQGAVKLLNVSKQVRKEVIKK